MIWSNGGTEMYFEVIRIDSIPDEIEQREDEKVCLSNLILEFFRVPPSFSMSVELVCNSVSVTDQLHNGKPNFFIVVYVLSDGDKGKKLKDRVDAMLQILHRMGYITTRIQSTRELGILVPDGLVGPEDICMVQNMAEQTEHQLLSIGVPVAFDNMIALMANVPDSLFSIMLTGDDSGQVMFCIQVFAKEEMSARLLYLNFIQGMKKTFSTESCKVKFETVGDYLNCRLEKCIFSIMSYEEFSNVLQLPFGRRSGIPITPQQRRLPLFGHGLVNGTGDVEMGEIIGSLGKKLTLPLQRQVNHMSVLGISGSGKSNFLLHYLNDMYNKYGIPFLVIDPVSTEFRILKNSLNEKRLNVFTPGSEVSPFEFNLFALVCESLPVREYKLVLKNYLRNCLQLFSPLDKLIDETVDSIFLQKKWYDASTKKELPGIEFTIDDFIDTFNQVFERSRFSGHLENMASSGRVRLNALRSFFNSIAPIPLADVMSVPTIVELGRLQSAEAKSTMLLYLLSVVKLYMMESAARIREDENKSQVGTPSLILVIDEAHSILEMQKHGEGMNIAQQGVVDTINQLLLEYRKYGLSVVIADQRVSVLQDVLTNTHVQVIFKQIDPVGKQVASDIISLEETQMLSMQKTGEAFVKHEKLETPVQVQMPKYECEVADTTDKCVHEYMKRDFWEKHKELTKPYAQCGRYCALEMCDRKRRSIIANLAERYLGRLTGDALKNNPRVVRAILKKEKLFDSDESAAICLYIHLNSMLKRVAVPKPKTNKQ